MSYNQEEEKIKTTDTASKREDGTVGIRTTLNNMGFSNNRIGYNESDGTVTLDNRTLMKPTFLDSDAGVSYASEKDIQKSLVNFFKDSNDPIVRVSDAYSAAAGKYGLSADALSYSNGTVSIGGKPLDILYIDDTGKSWAFKSAVEDSATTYADTAGVQSPTALAQTYAQRYLSDAVELAKDLKTRDAFSYDPDSDPVYQAYKEKYLLEGERASRDAMANYATLTGGYTNSAAATAGAQAELYYAQQLSNAIPTLAEQAYARYHNQYQNDLALLGSMVDLYDTAYQNAADANTAQRNNVNLSAASNVARDQESLESSWEEYLNTQTAEKNALTNAGLRLDNLQQEIYQKYYEQLLNAELSVKSLNNQLTQAKIYQAYSK